MTSPGYGFSSHYSKKPRSPVSRVSGNIDWQCHVTTVCGLGSAEQEQVKFPGVKPWNLGQWVGLPGTVFLPGYQAGQRRLGRSCGLWTPHTPSFCLCLADGAKVKEGEKAQVRAVAEMSGQSQGKGCDLACWEGLPRNHLLEVSLTFFFFSFSPWPTMRKNILHHSSVTHRHVISVASRKQPLTLPRLTLSEHTSHRMLVTSHFVETPLSQFPVWRA